ncbi:MAG: AbrB/MazE/SpoVT family DNA-binding domain-containing protein [Thermoleophilaceae bacterium]|nr:AbrB/MazE/SpoVT family DNA-binding domain-containing protein [Thermoleophilaceae bacterium]
MTYKVGPKGQIVIPKAVREKLGIQPGDHCVVRVDDDEVRVRKVRDDLPLLGLAQALGLTPKPGSELGTAALERERREDRAREERKAREWT